MESRTCPHDQFPDASHKLLKYLRCRSCTSFAAWAALTKKRTLPSQSDTSNTPLEPPSGCPPDVDQLGRASWMLLHSIAAQYPVTPSKEEQVNAKQFIRTFSNLYPCWSCATDFQMWMKSDKNAPRLSSRQDFGQWLCEAHNEVNMKLGKPTFDCGRWEERWRTGWKDGRCD
jgi:FAD-linked sulfhydryl oxidase